MHVVFELPEPELGVGLGSVGGHDVRDRPGLAVGDGQEHIALRRIDEALDSPTAEDDRVTPDASPQEGTNSVDEGDQQE
jgi:hypothetical protein